MKVLIVGLGSIAKKHIAAINKIEKNIEIWALRSSKQASKYNGVKNIYSFEELKTIEVDFAIISNPTSEHYKSIEQLSELGCPLFIEKPLFHKLDIEELVLKVEKKGILTYIACNLRFLDVIQKVKDECTNSNRRVNEINVYCGSYLPDWRSGIDFKKVYSAIPELGGGVHIDLIHEIDYIYWIFGSPNSISKTFRKNSNLEINSVDYANYMMVYEQFCASIVLNYYRRDAKRTLEIVFEDETWFIDLIQNQISVKDKVIFDSSQGILETYESQMEYFLNLVKLQKKESFNNISEAFNVLKLCIGDE